MFHQLDPTVAICRAGAPRRAALVFAAVGLLANATLATTAQATTDGSSSAGDGCDKSRVGGEVTMGAGTLAAGLDPIVAFGSGGSGGTELGAIYDSLMRFDYTLGEYVPHVAESLDASEDLREWTLVLRPGIEFGNGDPLTADAVKWNVERMAESSRATAAQAQEIDTMEVVDDLTLKFVLQRPWGTFPHLLAVEAGMIANPAVVEEQGDDFPTNPVGAGVGPYEFERFAPGEEITMVAKDDYWGGDVCIERLRFVSVAGGQATLEAMLNDEIQVMFNNDPDAIAQAKQEGIDGESALLGGYVLYLNSGRGESPVFADLRLRQAVAHAIDQQFLDERTGGNGWPTNTIMHPEQAIYPDVPGIEYDAARARQLIDEAKQDGFDGTIRLVSSNTPADVERALTLEAQLTAVGFTVVRDELPPSHVSQTVLIDGNYDISPQMMAVLDEGPFRGVNQWLSGSNRNRSGFNSPEMDAAIELIYEARDLDEAREAMGVMQEVWNEQVPAVPLAAGEWFVGWSDDVHGMVRNVAATLLFHDAYLADS